jgi:hypothetical protein
MHEILEVGYFSSLPHEGDLLERLDLDAVGWHPLGERREYLIAMIFVFESEVVRLIGDDLQPDIPQLVPPLEEFPDPADFDGVDFLGRDVVKRLEIDLLIGHEDISEDVVEGQHTAGEDADLGDHRLFGYAFNEAHVKVLFVELLSDHLVDLVLHVVVVFLLGCVDEEGQPLAQVVDLFVCRHDLHFLLEVLVDLKGLWRTIGDNPNGGHPRDGEAEGI